MKVSLFAFLTVFGGLVIAITTLFTLVALQREPEITTNKLLMIGGMEIVTFITSFIISAMANYAQPHKYRLEITAYRTLLMWLVINIVMCVLAAGKL